MRIIFMGTPEFAVSSLAALEKAGKNIVAVVTAPDRPAGRGQKLQQSAVKQYAVAQGIPVLQPEKLRNPEFIAALKAFNADLQVVVAFRMLPEMVWNMPPKGTINLHASLLPQYRGAAPINHAIINGESESGVTTFLLQHEIDTGNILFAEKAEILNDDTAGDLHDKLMELGARLIVKTVNAVEADTIKPIPQTALSTGETLKHAPKIFKEDCVIHWDRPVSAVYNLIRGLSPYPTAFTQLDGKTLKLFKVIPETAVVTVKPGAIDTDGKTYLRFACSDGYIRVIELQIEGKKRMGFEEFLRGYRFE